MDTMRSPPLTRSCWISSFIIIGQPSVRILILVRHPSIRSWNPPRKSVTVRFHPSIYPGPAEIEPQALVLFQSSVEQLIAFSAARHLLLIFNSNPNSATPAKRGVYCILSVPSKIAYAFSVQSIPVQVEFAQFVASIGRLSCIPRIM
jgi:hypothetical protein